MKECVRLNWNIWLVDYCMQEWMIRSKAFIKGSTSYTEVGMRLNHTDYKGKQHNAKTTALGDSCFF